MPSGINKRQITALSHDLKAQRNHESGKTTDHHEKMGNRNFNDFDHKSEKNSDFGINPLKDRARSDLVSLQLSLNGS